MADNKKAQEMDKFWHTTAHVFAAALTDLFPKVKIAIGPPIEQGFHYDFELDKNIDEKDLAKIEAKMKEILKQKDKMVQKDVSIKEALALFKDNPYKVEMIKDLEKEGENKISTYANGKFLDMCKGPHLESTAEIGAVKLLKISAAYWKGNEKNKQLQRVYVISFRTQKELDDWIETRKKAEENSHIKLSRDLDLFMISNSVGQGLPIWCPNLTMVRIQLQDFLVKEQIRRGYSFIITPHIGSKQLFTTSGHLEHYKEMMYAPLKIDEDEYYLKPMNCPFHIQYYLKEPRSYRDLPVKLSEMGTVYRYEKSGELSGLFRVRGFTQDDAHIFCTEDQLVEEFVKVFEFVIKVMNTMKLKNFRVRIGTKDPNSNKYIGADSVWEKATNAIKDAVKQKNIPFEVAQGEAAFYGPKADILVKDSLDREWQTGTIQVDYNLPERFQLDYIGSDGLKHRPIMIHRAALGSFERFTGIVIEHFGGAFPLWLAPEQVRIITISDNFADYGRQVFETLMDNEIRAKLDDRNETLGYKIREAQKQKVPYVLVVGAKEKETGNVAVRPRQGAQEVMPLQKFVEKALKEIKDKA